MIHDKKQWITEIDEWQTKQEKKIMNDENNELQK